MLRCCGGTLVSGCFQQPIERLNVPQGHGRRNYPQHLLWSSLGVVCRIVLSLQLSCLGLHGLIFTSMQASATSWRRTPFKDGVPLAYQAIFNSEQFARLKVGHIPRGMDDKWFIYYEEPHLFLHRSWTGQPVYRLTLKNVPNGPRPVPSISFARSELAIS